jgi:dolichol-phosphate mannosyltransferase
MRKGGSTKNNLFSLYDIAMRGVVSHSLFPIRLVTLFGFILIMLSIIGTFAVLIIKIMYSDSFPIVFAALFIFLLFLFGVVIISIGVFGEYIGSILTYLQNRPVVVEAERIGFN